MNAPIISATDAMLAAGNSSISTPSTSVARPDATFQPKPSSAR